MIKTQKLRNSRKITEKLIKTESFPEETNVRFNFFSFAESPGANHVNVVGRGVWLGQFIGFAFP